MPEGFPEYIALHCPGSEDGRNCTNALLMPVSAITGSVHKLHAAIIASGWLMVKSMHAPTETPFIDVLCARCSARSGVSDDMPQA